ncbi:hypothetical protein G7Z17_g1716 [Cylindrodendrum hubeiense]|uniref:Protein kinase domain-containing protein n=1 Tax=Cylindrodendrum hubeiense TaxID=595255 RepID=A0A9P5HE83_9HYPO|nr:hypothetical protein G7Z17_g1716 [Cylindrodendrum hubeiense]
MAVAEASRGDFDGAIMDQGDFVDSDDEIDVEMSAEDPEGYENGVYYPICIGEILAKRYRIEHKLGHGGFATVWMAYDILGKRDIALKIAMPGDSGDREYRIQSEIIKTIQDTSNLLIFHDMFYVQGLYGDHRVFVFPLKGPNLRDFAQQKSVDTHLNTANVMYSLRPLEDCITTTAKYKQLGRPKKLNLPPFAAPWKQGELVTPMAPHDSLVGDTVCIGDFGQAIKAGTSVTQKVQSPPIYCAPELFHTANPSFASDMWSYMCIFAELYLGCPLFSAPGNSTTVTFMVDTLGPLPATWKGCYEASGRPCHDSWYDPARMPDPRLAIEAKVPRIRSDTGLAERQLVLSILRRGLSYLPKHRLTAGQLLEDPAFKELMGIYGL